MQVILLCPSEKCNCYVKPYLSSFFFMIISWWLNCTVGIVTFRDKKAVVTLQKPSSKGFEFLVGFVILNIIFIWIERQSNSGDVLENDSGLKASFLVPTLKPVSFLPLMCGEGDQVGGPPPCPLLAWGWGAGPARPEAGTLGACAFKQLLAPSGRSCSGPVLLRSYIEEVLFLKLCFSSDVLLAYVSSDGSTNKTPDKEESPSWGAVLIVEAPQCRPTHPSFPMLGTVSSFSLLQGEIIHSISIA